MKTAKLIVFLCAAVLVILGVYSLFVTKDIFSGIIWTVLGIFFFVLGYMRLN
jgi:hypothetical protein